jgi:quinoprotein glucose dehydrogenase
MELSMRPRRLPLGLLLLLVVSIVTTVVLSGQSSAQNTDWRSYGADLRNTRYSPLDQVNGDNFGKLEVAWRYKPDNLGPGREFKFESTPLMANGVLYSTAGTRRAVVALDAGTGELLWMHRLDEGKRGSVSPRRLSGRGLAYWTDGKEERIVYVTIGYQMVALDAKTGVPIPSFGINGIVDLKQEMDQPIDPVTGDLGLHSTPAIAKNVIVVGAAHSPGGVPKSRTNEKGYVRAYDVRTGKRKWIFHTIPQPGEVGNETWLNDSWVYTGNTGSWGQISVDEELGLAYLPIETPTGDLFGGHRHGANLFGESLVAVDLETGQRKWHYQFIHHGIWDWDLPCAPILVDITVNGKLIKAVAQPSKQAFLYVLDRVTGQPVWPIEERAVPKGDVPGEWYAPTQPFPTKPPAYDRQGLSLDDLIDFTPELKAEAVKAVSRYKIGPIFTPPVVSTWEGPLSTLMLPSLGGGTNWPGGSFDPETGILYVFSATTVGQAGLLVSDGKRSDMSYIMGTARNPAAPPPASGGGGGGAAAEGGLGGPNVQGLPLVKPPWGRITAIDLHKGEFVWQIAHGATPDAVRNHQALKGLDIPRTGQSAHVGTLVTRTLVIAGEGGFTTTSTGQRGAMLRAYDKKTGAEVGSVYMPAPQSGSPMTYLVNGKQYIVVAVSGGTYSAELIAFRLPS